MGFNFDKVSFGKATGSKWGISLKALPTYLKRYVRKNRQFKEVKNLRVLAHLFEMRHDEIKTRGKHKLVFSRISGEITKKSSYLEESNSMDFDCPYCKTKFSINLNRFNLDSITCDDCSTDFELRAKVMKSIEIFRKRVTLTMRDEYTHLKKFIRKNKK